jgi:hypothetical protein
MTGDPVFYVSCSSCGRDFLARGRTHGFSHCGDHAAFTPLLNDDEMW